jgi:hypothetical protein
VATDKERETRAALYITPKVVFVQATKPELGNGHQKARPRSQASTFRLLAPEKVRKKYEKSTKKQHWFLVPVIPFRYKVFDGLTVMISACHMAKRGRPGFDSPSERIASLSSCSETSFISISGLVVINPSLP